MMQVSSEVAGHPFGSRARESSYRPGCINTGPTGHSSSVGDIGNNRRDSPNPQDESEIPTPAYDIIGRYCLPEVPVVDDDDGELQDLCDSLVASLGPSEDEEETWENLSTCECGGYRCLLCWQIADMYGQGYMGYFYSPLPYTFEPNAEEFRIARGLLRPATPKLHPSLVTLGIVDARSLSQVARSLRPTITYSSSTPVGRVVDERLRHMTVRNIPGDVVCASVPTSDVGSRGYRSSGLDSALDQLSDTSSRRSRQRANRSRGTPKPVAPAVDATTAGPPTAPEPLIPDGGPRLAEIRREEADPPLPPATVFLYTSECLKGVLERGSYEFIFPFDDERKCAWSYGYRCRKRLEIPGDPYAKVMHDVGGASIAHTHAIDNVRYHCNTVGITDPDHHRAITQKLMIQRMVDNMHGLTTSATPLGDLNSLAPAYDTMVYSAFKTGIAAAKLPITLMVCSVASRQLLKMHLYPATLPRVGIWEGAGTSVLKYLIARYLVQQYGMRGWYTAIALHLPIMQHIGFSTIKLVSLRFMELSCDSSPQPLVNAYRALYDLVSQLISPVSDVDKLLKAAGALATRLNLSA